MSVTGASSSGGFKNINTGNINPPVNTRSINNSEVIKKEEIQTTTFTGDKLIIPVQSKTAPNVLNFASPLVSNSSVASQPTRSENANLLKSINIDDAKIGFVKSSPLFMEIMRLKAEN